MKKKILVIFLALFMVFSLTSCKTEEKEYTKEDYTLVLNVGNNDKLNILQLTDIHIGLMDKLDDHYAFMKKVVNDASTVEPIGLIVVTGDLFTFATKQNANDLFSFFDSLEIPWTVTFGNHDEQCYFSMDWLTSKLNHLNELREEGKSYCYFIDLQDDNVKGNANFVIDVKNNDGVFEKIVIMDSNRYTYGSVNGYDYMDETQIEWFKKVTDSTTNSLMFFHIPLNEYSKFDDGENTDEFIFGKYGEDACDSKVENDFFRVIKTTTKVQGIFVGHDHINDYLFDCDGVLLSYGVKTTNRVYYDEGMLGGQIIKVKKNNNLNESDIIHLLYENYDSNLVVERNED